MTQQEMANNMKDADELITTAIKKLDQEEKQKIADILLGMTLTKKAEKRA